MAEQIIDIRERIEKMRIKFDDDDKSNFNDEKKVVYQEKKEINNLGNEKVVNHQKIDIKTKRSLPDFNNKKKLFK